MTSKKRYFGTDGIRAKVGTYPMTPEFVLKLGWAIGIAIKSFSQKSMDGSHNILVGKDTRISGYVLESALQAGILSAGVDVHLVGPLPTPAIAYLTRTFSMSAGVVISASHNRFDDNGIKIIMEDGYKPCDKIEQYIEELLETPMKISDSENIGKASRITDANGRYVELCKSTFPFKYDLSSFKKIILDCANGATYSIAPRVFRELNANIDVIAYQPNGININLDCGSTYPRNLQAEVLRQKADLGIAFDGDGDRLVIVDERGEILDGDDILYIIAKAQQLKHGNIKGVVGTIVSNLGLENKFNEMNILFERTAVGDRYVSARMRELEWELGGEPSGHILCNKRTTTGDGIISALQVLAAIIQSDYPKLSDFRAEWDRYPQHQINMPVSQSLSGETAQKIAQDFSDQLPDGRIIVRSSGTEPVIRIVTESPNKKQNRRVAQLVKTHIESSFINVS